MTLRRALFQVYVRGCDEAIALYSSAFGAECTTLVRDPGDGSVVHAELDVLGQVVALSERRGEPVVGTTMQFALHLGEGGQGFAGRAYEVLKEGADVSDPIGPTFYSSCMFSLVDRFGVSWCLFT